MRPPVPARTISPYNTTRMEPMARWKSGAVLAAVVLAACGDGPEGPDERVMVAITPQADTLNMIGDGLRLEAVVLDASGRILPEAEVEWTSLDGGIATVDGEGRVVGLAEGVARIRAASGAASDTAMVLVRSGVPPEEMRFVKFSPFTGGRIPAEASFYAVKGEDRRLVMRYDPLPGETTGEEFLEFRVPAEALWKRPGGTVFAPGDSVLITVAVDDSTGFSFRFEPSGLLFDPEQPARLKIRYREADDDLDGDGDDDADDDELEQLLAVWRQERPGERWLRLFSAKFEDLEEVEALVFGFTGFALATN